MHLSNERSSNKNDYPTAIWGCCGRNVAGWHNEKKKKKPETSPTPKKNKTENTHTIWGNDKKTQKQQASDLYAAAFVYDSFFFLEKQLHD